MTVQTTLSLSGHIIDSLTLAKVMDLLDQVVGVTYAVKNVAVGAKKQDLSQAVIELTTEDEAIRDFVLDQLRPYGVLPVTSTP